MPNYRVAILGHGSHGKDIEVIWNSKHPLWPMECYDDTTGGPPDDPDLNWYIGINDSQQRARRAKTLDGEDAMPLVHDSAVIDERCTFQKGVVVGANTTILHDVTLGRHTHVNYNVGMTRCTVGDFVTIAPGVTIAGDVTIGNRVFIGMGALICNLTTIPDDTFIKAGTVWTQR